MNKKTGFFFGSFNPLHDGHLYLIREALKRVETLDIYIGNKKRLTRMPWEIRQKSMLQALEHEDLSDRVTILNESTLFQEISIGSYKLAVVGSDIANLISSGNSKIEPDETAHIFRADSYLILDRHDHPIDSTSLNILSKKANVEIVQSTYKLSASGIKKAYVRGENIQSMVPYYIWPIIKDNIHVFKNLPLFQEP